MVLLLVTNFSTHQQLNNYLGSVGELQNSSLAAYTYVHAVINIKMSTQLRTHNIPTMVSFRPLLWCGFVTYTPNPQHKCDVDKWEKGRSNWFNRIDWLEEYNDLKYSS